jgi:hypothetical protein
MAAVHPGTLATGSPTERRKKYQVTRIDTFRQPSLCYLFKKGQYIWCLRIENERNNNGENKPEF